MDRQVVLDDGDALGSRIGGTHILVELHQRALGDLAGPPVRYLAAHGVERSDEPCQRVVSLAELRSWLVASALCTGAGLPPVPPRGAGDHCWPHLISDLQQGGGPFTQIGKRGVIAKVN